MKENIKSLLPSGEIMKGKKGLIMGVANDRSLAYGIAAATFLQGAELAFSYQGDIMLKRVAPIAKQFNSELVLPCDVTDSLSIKNLAAEIKQKWGELDFIVHAIAFSDKEELKGRYVDTTIGNFTKTMNVSCYSFVNICKEFESILNDNASLLTLSYYGAEKVVPHYNVMGVAKAALEASVKYLAHDFGKQNIRVNAISAGPIKTLAASGIGDFRYILKWNEYNAPLRRNTTIWDVGKTSVYLLSQLASGTTGEVVHVDCGYHTVGMKQVDAPDISTV